MNESIATGVYAHMGYFLAVDAEKQQITHRKFRAFNA